MVKVTVNFSIGDMAHLRPGLATWWAVGKEGQSFGSKNKASAISLT